MGASSSKTNDLESEVKALKATVAECELSLENSNNALRITKSPSLVHTGKPTHQPLHDENPQVNVNTDSMLSLLTDNTLNSMYTPKLGIPASYNDNASPNVKSQHISKQTATMKTDAAKFFKSKTFEPNECKLKCNADPNCELYVHNPKQNVCWFKQLDN
tara:strand:+ start:1091 stop:1570 length:480 start_codon:yes stop_codon:yes gene_type:complete